MTPPVVATLPAVVETPASSSPADAARAAALRPADLPLGLVVATCAWWLLAVPRMWGGRDVGAVSIGAFMLIAAIIAIRPHRYLPARVIGFALAISVGALGVALAAPTGWAGASTAATYVAVSWLAVAVAAAVVRDPRVTDVLAALLALGVFVEMAEAWLPWWGGADPSSAITGTFYWHNPFAAFMIAGALVGLVLWLQRDRALAALGLLSFTVGTVGVVYSTSRAAGCCFALALVILAVAHVLRDRWQGLRRVAIAVAAAAGTTWAVAGPPFFPHRASPLAATSARTAGQSLGQNGHYRLEFWHEALSVFARHPLTGGGYHSLASESVGHVPSGWALSPLVHNGYLQALSDGGLLLAVPFLLALAGVCWWLIASLAGAVRDRDFSITRFVVPLCLGALLGHSAIDFDWSYAADFAVVAILVGLLAATRSAQERPTTSVRRTRLLAGAVGLGLVLLTVSGVAAWHGDIRQSLPIAHAVPVGSAQ